MQINATKREQLGKKVRRLRQERKIPAVVFGPDMESIPLALEYKDFVDTFVEAGETVLVDLSVEGEKEGMKVLIQDVQLDPLDYSVIHAAFYKVNLTETTEVDIPVVIEGEESIELVKIGEALVLNQLSEITVSALPAELPREFVVDVSGLVEIGDSITVAGLDYDREKVEIVGHDEDAVVAVLDYATIEEEEEEEALTEEELIAGMEALEESEALEEGEEGAESSAEPKEPAASEGESSE
jgi:large subunit ribosomal protein L25